MCYEVKLRGVVLSLLILYLRDVVLRSRKRQGAGRWDKPRGENLLRSLLLGFRVRRESDMRQQENFSSNLSVWSKMVRGARA